MLNKIFVFGGATLILILVFSSMASGGTNVPFLWTSISVWLLIIYTSIIGIFMGYGINDMLKSKNGDDDNYDF